MPRKRRVLVVFRAPSADELKLVISINEEATVDDLANEIAEAVDERGVTLEIGAGFKLRGKDTVDVILDSDVVVAKPRPMAHLPAQLGIEDRPSIDPYITAPDETGRFQIKLVTAELARGYAKRNLKNLSEPTDGILAFDGEPVNGNTTIATLRQEASCIFYWTSVIAEDEDCQHETKGSCSCAIARMVEQQGLFSTLHCRLSINGTKCSNPGCPYSHAELPELGRLPPHCSVCEEALAFPCPVCLASAEASGDEPQSVIYCPLVQNAGCGHLHHSHCLGDRKDSSVLGCPSGCAIAEVRRESVAFDYASPHIIIVWDGDKINKIRIPKLVAARSGHLFALQTASVLSLVEDFLRSNNFVMPGLSLRIHFRDPATETVIYTQSTLVSVCLASAHENQDHYRFALFAEVAPPVKYQRANGGFSVDFHTSESPVFVCGCTRLRELFSPSEETTQRSVTPLTLYVVKRETGPKTDTTIASRTSRSKESTYLSDEAWQPSVPQSNRGMAALLSSLYLLAASSSRRGVTAESKTLAALYTITRFPPAVRSLGVLLLNATLHPQEKAALSEALYQALKDFASRGPSSITSNPSRLFETARILLAHILSVVDTPSQIEPMIRPLKSLSLVCAISNKRMTDPVISRPSTAIVERAVGTFFTPGGFLYRPNSANESPQNIEEIRGQLRQLLAQTLEFLAPSIFVLNLDLFAPLSSTWPSSLEHVGRDFLVAIKRANETELVSRGPLELKSTDVIPPQIVLDEDGLLAIFTGRGCGTTRDVNFFRPTADGDTEVDVNDVSFGLEKVIATRKFEDTWQIDNFGGIQAQARTPDEAIMLCLDISQSMNEISSISDLNDAAELEEFDPEIESHKAVKDLLDGFSEETILNSAKRYLKSQHPSCHHGWLYCITTDLSASDLIGELGIMAYREVLISVLSEGEGAASEEVMMLACFALASTDQSDDVTGYLQELLENLDYGVDIGTEPYCVPQNLMDPITGDLLVEPICVTGTHDSRVIINKTSNIYGSGRAWPSGHFSSRWEDPADVSVSVNRWMSANDILSTIDQSDRVEITLNHMAKEFRWHIQTSTSTRVLYQLVQRATRAQFSSFTIRIPSSRVTIPDSASRTIGSTDLVSGGKIEISRSSPHSRRQFEIHVTFLSGDVQKILLPQDATVLSLLSYIRTPESECLSEIKLWYGLRDVGDGSRHGRVVRVQESIRNFTKIPSQPIMFDCRSWFWSPVGSQKSKEKSRHITRLQLLKELFVVFLNRASSFDTSVSLVLGLITFSSQATVKQELTPIFENFRLVLERISAAGDTAVYDALDMARNNLITFRPDLPQLRKRIIIVSDGEDTSSNSTSDDVCSALQRDRVVVDSVQVGRSHNRTLHAFSVATGGYRFFPKTSLGDALSIFDLETMLYSAERPPTRFFPLPHAYQMRRYGNTSLFPIDIITIDQFPKRAEHPKLQGAVHDISKTETGISVGSLSNDHMKRIMRELAALISDPHPQIDIYVNDEDISFLKIIIEAPNDIDKCPYKGGCFLLTCDLPTGYPRDPPEIRFVTFILHPNVSKQGKVCVAELGRLWSSDITLKELFSLVYGLLLEPDLENPLEIQASLKYYDDDGTYFLDAAKAVKEHANISRDTWRVKLDSESTDAGW